MIIAIIFTAFFTVGAVLNVTRAGETKNLCKYDYMEDNKK